MGVKKTAEIISRCGVYFSILAAVFDGRESGVDWTKLLGARLFGFSELMELVSKGEFVGFFVQGEWRCSKSLGNGDEFQVLCFFCVRSY